MSDNIVNETTNSILVEPNSTDNTLVEPSHEVSISEPSQVSQTETCEEAKVVPSEMTFAHFSTVRGINIVVMEKTCITRISPRGPVEWKYFEIPCLYKHTQDGQEFLGNFVIKGCEMFSMKGILKRKYMHSTDIMGYALVGIISNSFSENVLFKSVMDECISQLSILTESELRSPFRTSGDTYSMGLPFMNEKTVPNFFDLNGNVLQWYTLTGVSLRFIPTFHITKVHLSPYINKVCINLQEVTVTHVNTMIYASPQIIKHPLDEYERRMTAKVIRDTDEIVQKTVDVTTTVTYPSCTLF